jgi:hypothetical protein
MHALNQHVLCRIRVWAASIRDGNQTYGEVAKTICRLLDIRTGLASADALASTDASIALLVGTLILAGLPGPS